MEYKRLKPGRVALDPENPRLPDGTSSDAEAILKLLDDDYQALLRLARDIVDEGTTNPSELPIVYRSGRSLVVLEGNRRFAALRLLRDPELAKQPARVAAFKRLAQGASVPDDVMCLVVEERSEADHWIDLRHTGYNNGVGVKGWSVPQTARRRTRAQKPVDAGTVRAITIAADVAQAYAQDAALLELVKHVSTKRLTNIGRLFSPDVLTRLHFAILAEPDGHHMLWVHHSSADLQPFFHWAFSYLKDNSVDAFKNDALRAKLLELAPRLTTASSEARFRLIEDPWRPEESGTDEDKDDPTARPNGGGDNSTDTSAGGNDDGDGEGESGASNEEDDESQSKDSTGDTTRKRDRRPSPYVFRDLRLPNSTTRIRQLLRQVRELKVANNAQVLAPVIRVTIELVVSQTRVLAWSGALERNSLSDKVQACIRRLDPKADSSRGYDPQLRQAWLESQADGVRYLDGFVHNPEFIIDEHLVRRFAEAFEPLLRRVDEQVAS